MANNQQDLEMKGEDFSEDVRAGGEDDQMNGSDNDQQQQQQQQQSGQQQQQQHGQNGGGQNGSAEAPGRDDDRKLFVGGLSWETTEKELREHFGQHGEIESINVKTDPQTGRSRGFAFIVYASAESIDKVTAAGEHIINNKKVDPKKAKARHGKIFVGGLTTEISDDEIKAFFGQFGTIVDVEMPFDKTKNQRKGFCFITFDSEQVVNELLKTPKQTISGKEVDVKKATPKPDNMPMGMIRGGGRGGRGGRGGGRGGYGQGGWGNQGGYGYGQGYGGGYDGGYGGYGGGGGGGGYDYYGGYSGYGGYPDYSGYSNYDYNGGYGNYDGGYNNGGGGGRSGGPRGGKGGGGGNNFQGGKQRGGGNGGARPQRHQPY